MQLTIPGVTLFNSVTHNSLELNYVLITSASAPASPSKSEGEDSSDIVITEETKTESTVRSKQSNLLAHPKVKSKCW